MQGREWTSLALLAPGNRTTAMGTGQPVQDRNDGEVREFQLNLDGQQITSNLGTGNQPYVQPRFDCRVPVHLEPVRCDAGSIGRRAGECHHEVGHQPVRGLVRRLLPRRLASTPRIRAAAWSCRSRISSTARRSADRSSRTSCTSSATSSTTASRASTRLEHALPGVQHRARRQEHQEDGRRPCGLSDVAEYAL